jgi:2-polyprenyl-3-methyl-5-hydroxy-6-metoxy-1,4-benzoquinol methylase
MISQQVFESSKASTAWQAQLGAAELQQQQHYDEIAAAYEAHYSDEWSVEYRRRFIYEPMFAGIELSGMKVLDAMCGSGQTTSYLTILSIVWPWLADCITFIRTSKPPCAKFIEC